MLDDLHFFFIIRFICLSCVFFYFLHQFIFFICSCLNFLFSQLIHFACYFGFWLRPWCFVIMILLSHDVTNHVSTCYALYIYPVSNLYMQFPLSSPLVWCLGFAFYLRDAFDCVYKTSVFFLLYYSPDICWWLFYVSHLYCYRRENCFVVSCV